MTGSCSAQIEHEVASLSSSVIGLQEGNLALFRGIPYASISQRWKHSRKLKTLKSPFDATRFGPRCPQLLGNVFVQGDVADPVVPDDEFNCLHLNITAPINALKSFETQTPALPVMVWIHGGAFNFGYNSVSRFRPERFCNNAIDRNQPVVLVSIGYRLGNFGFAASEDLKAELRDDAHNKCDDESSILGNFGLVDQRNALAWIQEHIKAFGGDPRNVTAFGVSAGSMSIYSHILTGTPLFDRAVMMSGTAGTLGPLPFDEYEDAWSTFISKSKADSRDSPAERLKYLRALDARTTLENYFTRKAIGPHADGKLLPRDWSHRNAQCPNRCRSVIIGDTQVEAIILNGLIRNIAEEQLHRLARQFLSPEDAHAFFQTFDFRSNMSRKAFEHSLRSFLSLMMFQFPALLAAEAYPGDVYYYHFDEPSPYEGVTNGIPFHGQDSIFVYQNDSDRYPPSTRDLARHMGDTWTNFAHGKEPWTKFSRNTGWVYMRWGPNGASDVVSRESDDVRPYGYLPWLRDHYEDVMMLARSIIAMEWGTP